MLRPPEYGVHRYDDALKHGAARPSCRARALCWIERRPEQLLKRRAGAIHRDAVAARMHGLNRAAGIEIGVGGDRRGRRRDISRQPLRHLVAWRDCRRTRLRRIGNADGRRAWTRSSGERIEHRRGEADTQYVFARRDPVQSQHGAVAKKAAAADGTLPAHDGVDAGMCKVPIGADTRREESRRGHRTNTGVPEAADGAIALERSTDDAEQGVQCGDRRLVERLVDAVAERRASANALGVRGRLDGELLSPDQRLSNGKRKRGRIGLSGEGQCAGSDTNQRQATERQEHGTHGCRHGGR